MTGLVAIIQARMGSTRLPGKVLTDLAGRPVLAHVVERARRIPGVDGVVVATTERRQDEPVDALARELGVQVFRGSERDVLDRYWRAAEATGASAVLRITADCPLLDPVLSGEVVRRFWAETADYASNIHPPTYPDGLDTEVVSLRALEAAWTEAKQDFEREHVTPFIWMNPARFRLANVQSGEDLSSLRWTLDEPGDLDFLNAVMDRLPAGHFAYADVLGVLGAHPELAKLNEGIERNAGFHASFDEQELHESRRQSR